MFSWQRLLLDWYRHAHRDLPWRATRDPYRILVSEIMLQQTRVEAVLPYYEAFLKRFPDAVALAEAPESAVLAQWSGLGYYSRARNLQRAARAIVEAGSFPADYESIRALPGVGEYTAAAVASIAFDLPHAAVDGNIRRVLARFFTYEGSAFQKLADESFDRQHPGEFNQAMMELGATTCVPKNPRCLLCPVRGHCGALASGRVAELPLKTKRPESRREAIAVAVIARDGVVLFRQRDAKASRMAEFWELPHVEDLPRGTKAVLAGSFRHTIVNTTFEVQVYTAVVRRTPGGMQWIQPGDAQRPITTISRKALEMISLRAVSLPAS